MKYSAALLISALAVLARAAVQLTNTDYTVTEGQPFTLTWTGSEDPVTIKLKSGASNDLKDVETITSSGSGGSFTWTPDNLPSGTYAFEIIDSSGQNNYSPQFSYQGTGTASVTASTATSTAASFSTTGSSSSSSSETKSTTSSARLTSSTMTPLTNSTTLTTSTSATSSRSSLTASTTSSATSSSTTVPSTNNGQRVASSLALILGAVAAFVAFN